MESDTKKLTDTTKLLRECDAGTKMVISSINEILEKVEDTKLSEILTKSRNAHEELESEIHSLLNYHKEEQKEPDPLVSKQMSKWESMKVIKQWLTLLPMDVIWELNL